MAKFEGVRWAERQIRFILKDKQCELLPGDDRTFSVSRSIHYGLFLCFEGIRFYCRRTETGGLQLVFLNWRKNLDRFQKGIAFNLGRDQQQWVPTPEEIETVFIDRYFRAPAMRGFLEEMARLNTQGYLRPFTLDEEQSIGVTFPANPAIRALALRYDRYLGEPFCGVVVPHLVRAVGVNRTGCLKLGVNYLMSVKAVDEARKTNANAAAALFLDDQPHLPLEERTITEWDSSCCLFAFTDGTVVKIPENPLILPSVTIVGISSILREMGVSVQERHLTYGELSNRARKGELVAACSVGTAGILNRCQELVLVGSDGQVTGAIAPLETDELWTALGQARGYYWDIYQGKREPAPGMILSRYDI